jgi:hypothetical protein
MTISTEDKLSIHEACARAYQALDGHNPKGWAAAFTPDGTFDAIYGVYKGRPEIEAFIRSHIEKGAENGAMHTVTNFVVEGDPKKPKCYAYIVKFGMDSRPAQILGCAKLEADMIKVDGKWYFEKLALGITLTAPSPAVPG